MHSVPAVGSESSDAPSQHPARPHRPTVTIAVVVVAAFVMFLNETILSVALRDLSTDLSVSTTTVQWVTSGFLLTMAVVIPTTGYLLQRFTTRQMFVTSLIVFTLGTLVCALAPNFAAFMSGRVVQASGTAIVMPLLMTTVVRLIPPARRGSAMGAITIVIALAPALGPTVGGAVLSSLGWRWMFWLVLPLAITVLAVGTVQLPNDSFSRPAPLDVLSVPLSAIGFGGLLYGLASIGESTGGHGVSTWVPIGLGIASLMFFVMRQVRLQRDDRALLDLRPLRLRSFSIALGVTFAVFTCMMAISAVLLPLYLQTALLTSTFVSGLVMLPGGLALGLLGPVVGHLYDRFGARPLVIAGALANAVALGLFTTLDATSTFAWVIAIHVLFMSSLGTMMTPLMTASLSSLPDSFHTHGSAILSTVQQMAGAFGIAFLVTVASLASGDTTGSPDPTGLHTAFVAAGLIGVMILASALFVREPSTLKSRTLTP